MEDIKIIIETKQKKDLEKAINCVSRLNCLNVFFEYSSLLLSYVGIFISAYATASNIIPLIWVGLGVSKLSALIATYQKINRKLVNKYEGNIDKIKMLLNRTTIAQKNETVMVEELREPFDRRKSTATFMTTPPDVSSNDNISNNPNEPADIAFSS